MEYEGDLYGKVGNKYFKLRQSTREVDDTKKALESLYLSAASISDMVPKIGKERSDYKRFREAMKAAESVLKFNSSNND